MLKKSKLKKNAIAASLQGEIAREIEELFGSQALEEIDFEALETAMRRRALQLAARLLEQRFNRDHSDYQGSSLPCACGRRARYVERRWKSFHSVVGELKLERAYYYCWECERGFCPRDRALGMDATSLSPAVVRMIGTVGAMVSFQEGSDLLTELAGGCQAGRENCRGSGKRDR